MKSPFKKLDPRLAAELRTQRQPIMLGLACVVVTGLFVAVQLVIIRQVTHDIEVGDFRSLAWLCGMVVVLFGIKYWFTRGQMYYLTLAANRLAADLRVRMYDKLQRLPVSYFNQSRVGELQSVMANDVSVYQNAVMIIRDSIDGPIRAVSAFIVVLTFQWQLAAIALVFVPPIALFVQRNGRKMRVAQTRVQEDQAEVLSFTQESLQGERVIKAFAAEDRKSQEHHGKVQTSLESQVEAAKRVASLRPMVELVGACALACALLAMGYFDKGIKAETLVTMVAALDAINGGLRTFGYVNNTFNQVQAASDRIYSLVLDVPNEIEDSADATTLPLVQGRIEFRNVSFEYPDGTKALNEVSFTIPAGESLALVGPSGAGKSTIADLLLRFYEPTSGEIMLDGVDIRTLKMQWLRSQIGVVPQQTFLFAGTIGDNIRLGAPEATDEEVQEASHAAHVDIFVDPMPRRYETSVGEGGVGLSGGEKQRVAIARAVVKKPQILLLDEATSNLDAVSEKHVQEALVEIMKERTTLFIAHRLTSAARADRILVLRRGEVLEAGTHRQLMEANGAYAGMYKAFSSGILDETLV